MLIPRPDADGAWLDSDSFVLSSALQELYVEADGIARVEIDTMSPQLVLDILVFPILVEDPNMVMLKNTLRWLSRQHRIFLPASLRHN